MKQKCNWYQHSKDVEDHAMSDFCYECGEFWDFIPTCPLHNKRLKKSGFCRDCKKYYDISEKVK